MTDYYPLIARAVAGLDRNTGESRRALYERARTALVGQLRGLDPPLTESEITRERLALEEAIRKVEAEAARKARLDLPRPDPAASMRPGGPARRDEAPRHPVNPEQAPQPPPNNPDAPRREAAAGGAKDPNATRRAEPASPGDAAASRGSARNRMRERPPLTDEGLKGFRDVVAEAETLGEATAQAARSAREVYVAVPSNDLEFDRIEPRVEPMGGRPPVRESPPARPVEPSPRGTEERTIARPPEPPRGADARPGPRPLAPRYQRMEDDDRPPRSMAGLIAALLVVLVIVGLAVAAYLQRDLIRGLFGAARTPSTQGQSDATATRPKLPDRIGQPAQPDQAGRPGAQAGKDSAPVAAVAQRVVLYEEDPADPQGKRYVGSAIWRTETVSPGPGLAPELAVRADFEIPERRITVTMSLRRNTDQALPASHTVELIFNLPSDFPFGGINNVPIILMKQAEQARGAPLAGLVVKVTPTFFLVGLSAVEGDVQRNTQLLKERPWFDIPIVYTNGRRAILAVEKGTPGERAFNEAFAAWGQ